MKMINIRTSCMHVGQVIKHPNEINNILEGFLNTFINTKSTSYLFVIINC